MSRPLTLGFLGCALMIAGLAGCDRQTAQKAQPQADTTGTAGAEPLAGSIDRSHRGSRMPDMTFSDAAGHEIHLANLAGKPLLINLWATWCGPCVAELPTLDRLAAARAGQLRVLTISQDLTAPEKVAAFLSAKGLAHLEPWLDQQNTASTQYQVVSLPTTIYYGADGREIWRYTGGHDWSAADTAAMLAETADTPPG